MIDWFVRLLNEELEKLNDFYMDKEEEFVIRFQCPTTVVPFVGDQFLWAARIYEKGLGPKPIPIDQLTVKALSNAIRFMLQPEVKSRATEIAKLIENEDGVAAAVDAFHRHLPPELSPPIQLSLKDDYRAPLQSFFTKIGNLCNLACS